MQGGMEEEEVVGGLEQGDEVRVEAVEERARRMEKALAEEQLEPSIPVLFPGAARNLTTQVEISSVWQVLPLGPVEARDAAEEGAAGEGVWARKVRRFDDQSPKVTNLIMTKSIYNLSLPQPTKWLQSKTFLLNSGYSSSLYRST